ncbi:MAG TPA: amidohydrolase family protein [Candidatus Solibacter sp.]|nr:amidohydrolase family protein [Candidatus Solibacter sp.]
MAITFPLFLAGCARETRSGIDSSLAADIAQMKAIDNHAHAALNSPTDREFDALPVDNMEPMSDPVGFRPGSPLVREAAKHFPNKAAARKEKGDAYPAWVLDQVGIETMLANRVTMGPGVQPPRFRWVSYVDALILPLDNSHLAARNPDRKAFFALEDKLRARYWSEAGATALPATLGDYLARIVTPTLERQRQGGAVAVKYEAAYLRSLSFDNADRAAADRVWTQRHPSDADYKSLQDLLFRYVAAECGRLGMAVHLHTSAGAGGYFEVAGANPLNLESLFNDPALRKTKFVMVHGGWPFIHEIGALLTKPNAYLDFSAQDLLLPPSVLAATLHEWLSYVPEKVLFGTDAYPYSEEMGWEESAWMASATAREALGRALTDMMRANEITPQRARELARMVLHDNAKSLYGL